MYENIASDEFQEKSVNDPNGIVLDVRTQQEVDAGYIPGAIVIDIMGPDFAEKVNELDKSKNYYVYCRSGNRSGQACGYMEGNGFDGELYNLSVGMMGWTGEVEK